MSAQTHAEMLGDKHGAKLLQATLDEEKQTDEKLTKLAKSWITIAAPRGNSDEMVEGETLDLKDDPALTKKSVVTR